MKYHTKAFATFHQINAFEEDGFLMVDLCCSDDGQAINNYLIQNLRKSGDALDEVATPYFSLNPGKLLNDAEPALLSPGVQLHRQGFPPTIRPATARHQRDGNRPQPEHSPLQSGHLCQNRQRYGEEEEEEECFYCSVMLKTK